KVLSMPQVSVEFLQIASLSRRRHGFDSRTGRQYCQSLTDIAVFANADSLIDAAARISCRQMFGTIQRHSLTTPGVSECYLTPYYCDLHNLFRKSGFCGLCRAQVGKKLVGN